MTVPHGHKNGTEKGPVAEGCIVHFRDMSLCGVALLPFGCGILQPRMADWLKTWEARVESNCITLTVWAVRSKRFVNVCASFVGYMKGYRHDKYSGADMLFGMGLAKNRPFDCFRNGHT